MSNLVISNTNRILRGTGSGGAEYEGQAPIQVDNNSHIISLDPNFSAQFAGSGVEAKVDEISSCCEQVHSAISSLETQVSSLSSTLETQVSSLSSVIDTISSELPDLDPYATKEWVTDQGYLTQIPDGYLTKAEAEVTYQPIGNYLTSADIENKLDVSALEYTDQGKISAYNGSAFVGEGEGTTYTPGQYISIDSNNEISVTGLQPEGDYVTDTELQTVSSDLKDLIPSTDEFLTKASADTLYQPIGEYQPAGDYLTSDDITGFATRDEVSSYLLKEEYSETSSFLQTEISAISAIVTSASDDYELIEGDYIKLTDNSANHTTEVSVTGLPDFTSFATKNELSSVSSEIVGEIPDVSDFITKEQTDEWYQPIGNYASASDLESYLTTAQYQVDSATFLTAHQDISNLATKNEVSAYVLKSESGVFQASGNYLSANALDGYATQQWVEDKGYLTAHQDLSDYAKSSALNLYLTNEVANELSGKLNEDIQYVSAHCLTAETDWTNTITAASSYAYNQAVAQIPEVTGFATKDELTGYESKINWTYVEV